MHNPLVPFIRPGVTLSKDLSIMVSRLNSCVLDQNPLICLMVESFDRLYRVLQQKNKGRAFVFDPNDNCRTPQSRN